jgi:hypothetical protein
MSIAGRLLARELGRCNRLHMPPVVSAQSVLTWAEPEQLFFCMSPRPGEATPSFAMSGEEGWVQLLTLDDHMQVVESASWEGHANAVFDLTWTADGANIVTASGDQKLGLWHVCSPCIRGIGSLSGVHTGSIKRVIRMTDEPHLLASCGRDGRVVLWDLRTGEPAMSHRFAGRGCTCMAAGGQGWLAVGCDRGDLFLLEPRLSLEPLVALERSEGKARRGVCALAAMPHGVAASYADASLSVFSLTSCGETMSTPLDCDHDFMFYNFLACKPHSNVLLSSSRTGMQVVQGDRQAPLLSWTGLEERAYGVCWCAGDWAACLSERGRIGMLQITRV